VILSAQATDKSVNLATEKLYKVANTPQALLKLGRREADQAHPDDRPLPDEGEERARDVQAADRAARRRSAGRSRALEALPGVGGRPRTSC
jgi:endonuclease-3